VIACEWHNTPMFDEIGAFAGLLSLAQDVTGRKKLEGQLRQAQKMEAVGQLAGGVAHDFNNLLSVVLSYSHLASIDLPINDPIRSDLDEIRRAGERAAELTRQLLLFSRHQLVQTKVLDLNELLLGIHKMLLRLVGEDVELTSVPGVALGHVRADPGSLEQVLMNLIVNARDALPTGGKITIETANIALDEEYARAHLGAKAGPHVMLSVTDSGTGMDKQTIARIFEPFFTTKEKGKGTGLGLSTVFGIVQQCGGTVWCTASWASVRPSRSTCLESTRPWRCRGLDPYRPRCRARRRSCSSKTKTRCALPHEAFSSDTATPSSTPVTLGKPSCSANSTSVESTCC
ncbi:MAG: ATP-binding protein, partial [Myxococcales bacterium]